jgi:aspartate racemase
MKRIGIIGGMSPESTLHYYECINRQVNGLAQKNGLGEHISADMVLRSVNFEEYCQLMDADNWKEIAKKLYVEATTLICKNDCDYVAIATNTMHKVAGDVCPSDQLVHIGDCVAEECLDKGF